VHPQRDCPANVGCEASVTVHPTTTPYGSLRIGPELDSPERRGPTGVVLVSPATTGSRRDSWPPPPWSTASPSLLRAKTDDDDVQWPLRGRLSVHSYADGSRPPLAQSSNSRRAHSGQYVTGLGGSSLVK
jgi:hypothetical protein